MVVVTVTNCPPDLRGDLSKWLCEINVGVYVGNISTRVRQNLWTRICENLSSGQATMVYPAMNEQGLDFKSWNSTWQAVDYDGIRLMKHPLSCEPNANEGKSYHSTAYGHLLAKRKMANDRKEYSCLNYTVVDIETTGLDPTKDQIIELSAAKVRKGVIESSYSQLIGVTCSIPANISQLTGISNEMIKAKGVELKSAVEKFLTFIDDDQLLLFNASFDLNFINQACKLYGYPIIENHIIDLYKEARKTFRYLSNYKLETIATFLGFPEQKHRGLDDCILIHKVFYKLNEKLIASKEKT